MAEVAVFDMNETTLDLAPARQVLDELFGERGFVVWFGRLLQTSMAVTATGGYQDFSVLARAALDSVAQSLGVALHDDDWPAVGAAIASAPPHPDVPAALDRLVEGGWTLVALTNSAQASVEGQLERAGLTEKFSEVLSVDSVRAFKPAAPPYLLAAERTGLAPSELLMVACHDWDLAGAKAAGMRTAFVARPGMPFASAYPPADLTAVDFGDLADQLLA